MRRQTTQTLLAAVACGLAGMAAAQDEATLLEAAKTEPPTTVYAVTGKIIDTAEAFSTKYGLTVTGKKVDESGQVDLLIRESQAKNVVGSVSVASDVAVITSELLTKGIVESWVPEGLAAELPEAAQNPLVAVSDPHVWAYNGAAHETCPVSNIWQLTEPEWSRLVSMMDPLERPSYADWFNQLETHHDAKMAATYEAQYGKPFDTASGSATEAWVTAFAANAPLIADSSGVSAAIGAPGQEKPFFGMLSAAKFRDNTDKGYSLAICEGMAPFTGWLYPGLAVIASGTASPNTAKLFVQYLLTEDGIAPQSIDGKIPADPRIGLPEAEASGVAGVLPELMVWDTSSSESDLDRRQDWQDIWRGSYRR